MWCVCLYIYMCILGACERKKVALDSLKLELKVVMSTPCERWSSERALGPRNYWVISPAPNLFTVAIIFKSILFHIRMFFSAFFCSCYLPNVSFPLFYLLPVDTLFNFWCTPSLGRHEQIYPLLVGFPATIKVHPGDTLSFGLFTEHGPEVTDGSVGDPQSSQVGRPWPSMDHDLHIVS